MSPAAARTSPYLDRDLTSASSLGWVILDASVHLLKSPAFLMTLQALAWAYCRYGPELPSKLSASSHLKTNCFSGWTLTMLYLTAPMPTMRAISLILSSGMSERRFLISW